MNTHHTPAPWKVSFEDENPDVAIITTEGGKCLATVYPEASPEVWPRFSNELSVRANAQLIAAAPDLLDILREISGRVVSNAQGSFNIAPSYIRAAREAVAKATHPTK